MTYEPKMLAAFEAAHLIAFGEPRTLKSYADETPGIERAIFRLHWIMDHIGTERLGQISAAGRALKLAVGDEVVAAYGRANKTQARLEGANRTNLRISRDSQNPPEGLNRLDPSWFRAPDYFIDVFNGTLCHPPVEGEPSDDHTPILDVRFEELRFDRREVAILWHPPEKPWWHPESNEQCVGWCHSTINEAAKRLTRPRSKRALAEIMHEMCEGRWTAGTIEKSLP